MIALPLTAASGALVFVTERDTAKFPLSAQSLVNPLLGERVNGSQRSTRCISKNTRSQVGPHWVFGRISPIF